MKDPFNWVGETIDGKFRVDSVVGEGGHGVVYRALHLGFAQMVAIKCLKLSPKLSGPAKERFFERFLAEGRLLHQLSRMSADIVQALDVGVATSPSGAWTPYIVLEWLEGESLDADLRHRAERGQPMRSVAEAVALLEPAARGLAVAHEQGVAHRDVKPANLFVAKIGGRETVKVVDFGIAKVLTSDDLEEQDRTPSLTGLRVDRTGLHPFTPRYAAPENYKREYGSTGPWSDVFSLGLVLVEVVTGKKALGGADVAELYAQACDMMKRPTLRDAGVKVSDAVEAVLLRALAVDPKRRFANAGEMWDALIEAIPELRDRKPSIRPGASAPPQPPARRSVRPEARRAALPLGIAVVAFAITVVMIVRMCSTGPAGGPASSETAAAPSASVSAPIAIASPASPSAAPSSSDAVGFGQTFVKGMVRVSAGAFVMGSDRDNKQDRPAHRVTLTRAYYIDKTEVTAEDYGECVRAKACTPNSVHTADVDEGAVYCNVPGDAAKSKHPVNCVDADQAAKYCKFVGKRLPTEAEWEHAARGEDGREWPWGDMPPETCWQGILTGVTGTCGERKGTWEVGTTVDGKSPYGAFDMAGNVFEWVADGFEPYPASEVVDPFMVAQPGARGVVRGGSWDYSPTWAKSTARFPFARSTGHVSVGFRCAKSIEVEASDASDAKGASNPWAGGAGGKGD